MNHTSAQMDFMFPHGKQEHILSLRWWALGRPQQNWFFLNQAWLAVRQVTAHRSCYWQSVNQRQALLFAVSHWDHKAKSEAGQRNPAELLTRQRDRWDSTAGLLAKGQYYACCWFSKKTIFPPVPWFEDSWVRSHPYPSLLHLYPSPCSQKWWEGIVKIWAMASVPAPSAVSQQYISVHHRKGKT